jgi:Flp pilus assembly protein TadB
MKKIIIAASIIGTAVAGAFWLIKNSSRAESALNDIKDAAKNAYRKMDKQARKAGRRANHIAQEQVA